MTEAEKRRLGTSGGEVAFLEMGDPEDPPVILLHGFPTSSYLWRNVAPLFSPWMHVIVPDLVGAGDSAHPADAQLDLVAQTGYVRELLNVLDISTVAAVGHGLGGGIVQRLALDGLAPVMGLLDAVAFEDWPGERLAEVRRRALEDGAVSAALVREILEGGLGHPERLTEADLSEYERPFLGDEGAAALARWLRAVDGRGLEGTESYLERLEVPALVLWGEDDPYVPASVAERFSDVLPMGSVALLPGCSHFLPEDAAETVAPFLFEFLRSRYLGTPHTHAAGPVMLELGRRPPSEEEK